MIIHQYEYNIMLANLKHLTAAAEKVFSLTIWATHKWECDLVLIIRLDNVAWTAVVWFADAEVYQFVCNLIVQDLSLPVYLQRY